MPLLDLENTIILSKFKIGDGKQYYTGELIGRSRQLSSTESEGKAEERPQAKPRLVESNTREKKRTLHAHEKAWGSYLASR